MRTMEINNILIFGIGLLGLEVAGQLQRKGKRVVLADNSETRVALAREDTNSPRATTIQARRFIPTASG